MKVYEEKNEALTTLSKALAAKLEGQEQSIEWATLQIVILQQTIVLNGLLEVLETISDNLVGAHGINVSLRHD